MLINLFYVVLHNTFYANIDTFWFSSTITTIIIIIVGPIQYNAVADQLSFLKVSQTVSVSISKGEEKMEGRRKEEEKEKDKEGREVEDKERKREQKKKKKSKKGNFV